jgi:hypothetical protein
MIDFTYFDKNKVNSLESLSEANFDIFISTYNDSYRVKTVYETITASEKYWLIAPEYNYQDSEIPTHKNVFFNNDLSDESKFILEFINHFDLKGQLSTESICIDSTGFSRPHLIYLLMYLHYSIKVKLVTILYTDPLSYVKNEKTKFSLRVQAKPRQIYLCEGSHSPDTSNDYLIIGAGYDHNLISYVAESKEKAFKIQLFGFPSLKPHMYQENLMRVYQARDSIGGHKFVNDHNSLFAPAYDPFVTAQVLKEFVNRENSKQKITNLYLSPLSTKAQTIGFVLFYLWECKGTSSSIIFPFCSQYSKETSEGISDIWKYEFRFPE